VPLAIGFVANLLTGLVIHCVVVTLVKMLSTMSTTHCLYGTLEYHPNVRDVSSLSVYYENVFDTNDDLLCDPCSFDV